MLFPDTLADILNLCLGERIQRIDGILQQPILCHIAAQDSIHHGFQLMVLFRRNWREQQLGQIAAEQFHITEQTGIVAGK